MQTQIITISILAIAISGTVAGQDTDLSPMPNVNVKFARHLEVEAPQIHSDQLQAVIDDCQRYYKVKMELRVATVSKVCGLTDVQKRRLTIAAKGAVDRTIRKLRSKKQDEFTVQGVIVGNRPLRESIWTRTIDKTLTDAQKSKLKVWDQAQKEAVKKRAKSKYRTHGGVI